MIAYLAIAILSGFHPVGRWGPVSFAHYDGGDRDYF
jgi:hypothetical protein